MRIVGGRFRGRPLVEPKSRDVRPTGDRARESLFNILAHRWPEFLDGARVLDLFAGTGALGLEALSRGAGFALFVDNSVEGRSLLRRNIETLGLTGNTRVFRRDATALGPLGAMEPFDLVFADPPYGKGLGEKAAGALVENGWILPGGLLVLEEKTGFAPRELEGFECLDQRETGIATIGFFRRNNKNVT